MFYSGPLATGDQIEAEKQALRFAVHPAVRSLQPGLRAMLENDPAAKTADGARQIGRVLDLWTMSHIMWQLGGDTANPRILWNIENSPHHWFGHEMPGMGVGGDNPDHIYRGAFLDGASAYAINGRMGARPPSQLIFDIFRGSPGQTIAQQAASTPNLGTQVSYLMNSAIKIRPDGHFTLTIGPEDGIKGENHLNSAPGPMQLVIRDVLADWREDPTTLEINRTGGPAQQPLSDAQFIERIVAELPGFVRFWSGFRTNWLGGVGENEIIGPLPREGGWGYILGGRFALREDDAIALTIDPVGARYIGFQVLNPWMMMPADARNATISLNNAQVQPNPDGCVTYVLSPKDPGIFNWIDTAGLRQGLYILRWQGVPKNAQARHMLRDFKIIKTSDIDRELLPSVPRIDPAGRMIQIARRSSDFDYRLGPQIDAPTPPA